MSKEEMTQDESKNTSELQEMAEESSENEELEQDEVLNLELDEVEILKEKIKELEDDKLRELAEFENLKKRYEKEKMTAIAYSNESFARDLLGVVDALENASKLEIDSENLQESLENIKEGIELTLEQFQKIFSKNHVEVVCCEDGFDPNFHEAIMKVDSDEHDEDQIVQEFQKGYTLKGRILRPAMVSIAK